MLADITVVNSLAADLDKHQNRMVYCSWDIHPQEYFTTRMTLELELRSKWRSSAVLVGFLVTTAFILHP